MRNPLKQLRLPMRRLDPRRVKTVAAVTVPVLVIALAAIYPGVPVAQVDLNDGAVWLTNTSALKLGRYNPQIDELNAGLIATATTFDVAQDAGDVLLVEPGRISVVDPASVSLTAQATVPFGASSSMSGGVIAVSDPAAGKVWARTTGTIGALAIDAQDPDLDLGPGGAAVVADGGAVLAARADGSLQRAEVTGTGATVVADGELAGAPTEKFDQVSAVGVQLVALVGRTLHTPNATVDLASFGADLVLQQPGPAAGAALVATPTALLEVPLDGGAVIEHTTGGTGAPVAPVRVGSCAHGAWASSADNYLQLCAGSDPQGSDLEGMTAGDELVFRVNRDVVVLNDTLRGRIWVPMEDPKLRDPNWQDIQPDDETTKDEKQSESTQNSQNVRAECSAQSAAPLAVDDEFGVRAGRTAIVSVIDNDSSSDCGILAISEFDPLPADFGTARPIYGGRALQVTTLPGATGTAQFTYTISDGRGTAAPSTASVLLTVHPDSENAPPTQLRVGAMTVEQGAAATYDVLPDFRDPNGDHLILSGAVAESGGTVRTRQDGRVTFQSDGGSLGRQTVHLIVSDGVETVDGTLMVDVRPVGSLAPVIDPIQVVTYIDQPVLVSPLASVRSASREPVRLAGVDELQGATLVTDLTAGTFTFTAPRAGTYYVSFLVTASPQQATGVARIDVRERPAEMLAPTAVLDIALLPPGGEVTIDPLANDVDPAGGVLVLQEVQVPAESGVRIAVLHHQLLRITATRVLEQPITATYTVSNGTTSATGEVLIQPIPASATQQAPVVPNVSVSVRTGGVVTIPVLAGAYDPDGDVVSLLREFAEPLVAGEGLLFVSGDVLRYQAPALPMDVHATFSVSDPAGNVTAATLTVSVHASEAASKPLPRPLPLTARVFAGETTRIQIPLTGIDTDGDGLALLGQDDAPTKGRITAVGADWMDYEALPGELGTDTFTYAVEDWAGQRAVAAIRVGIAARPTTSAQVISRNDDVTVRPGQSVEVRVLANDVDTGGGELELDPTLELADGIDARVVGRRIVVHTPDQAGVLQVSYTATNDRGGRDGAVLTVTVTDDARVLPPVARDVVVPAVETINRTSVEVDVLGVAENPSGPMSDLAVSVDASVSAVAVVSAQGAVVVTLIDHAQTLPYLLTNTSAKAEGASSYAFITVPALGDFPPMLRPGAPELVVVAGEQLVISLDEQLQVAPGRTARIADAASVQATKSDGSSLIHDDTTLLYRALAAYAGPASISFEVSDGAAGDPTARTKVISLPITVLAAADYPPTFTPSTIDVAPGESAKVELAAFASAPVGTVGGVERYTYTLNSSPPAGFEVAIDAGQLTVRASPTVPKGTVGGVALAIGYGTAGTIAAQIDFRVVASARPLARVVDVAVPDGVEGRSSSVSVLDGAFNPFPEQALTLIAATVETPGAGTAGIAGSAVSVRPAEGFIGSMVTRYRVRDVTGDPDREVEGRITVTVRGRPAAPTAPRVVEVRDRTVVLAWDAPVNNGEPISGYRVTASPGGIARDCASTTCTIDGLTNDTEYTFTVTAHNAVDWSDASPASAPARPDAVPAAPAAPTLVFGDGQVAASWAAPVSTGSPITSYAIEISPATSRGQASFESSGTSLSIGDLVNGTNYSVRVRAVNRAPDPGPWSAQSQAIPARAPDAATVTAMRGNTELGRQIDVTWVPGAANGDAIVDYELVISGPGGGTVTGLTATSYAFRDAKNGDEYTFSVRARNKAGLGPAGSARALTYGLPGVTGAVNAVPSAKADPGQGTVVLSWAAADANGNAVTNHRLEVDGQPRDVGAGLTTTVGGLVGGQSYSFAVRACNAAGCGAVSAPVSSIPITVPGQVQNLTLGATVMSSDNEPVSIPVSWAAMTAWGGADGQKYEYRCRIDNSDPVWTPATVTSGSCEPLPGLTKGKSSMEVTAEVRAVTSAGAGLSQSISRTVKRAVKPGPVGGPTLAVVPNPATAAWTANGTWTAPTDDGSSPITGYTVAVQFGGGAFSAPVAQTTTTWTREVTTAERVQNSAVVRITIRVCATNAVGAGPCTEATG